MIPAYNPLIGSMYGISTYISYSNVAFFDCKCSNLSSHSRSRFLYIHHIWSRYGYSQLANYYDPLIFELRPPPTASHAALARAYGVDVVRWFLVGGFPTWRICASQTRPFPHVTIRQFFESTPLKQTYQRKLLNHFGWKTIIFYWGIQTPTLCSFDRCVWKLGNPTPPK